jgi:Holliday junction resolvasome RuvABC ATP-dependent DNA helicase subunit
MALLELIESKKSWSGTASQLLIELNSENSANIGSKGWPKVANHLSNRVRRVAEPLRSSGIEVLEQKIKGRKIWSFRLKEDKGVDGK